jgi:CubicO group peptidase (beta-lactamase class C family)
MPSARLKIAGLVTLAVATLVAVAVAANPAASRAAPRAKLQRAVDALAAAGAPGAVALVRDGDRTIRVAGGYGNLAKRTPMRARHRFRVGSSTKTFVAAVVLQLAGEGKLALEDSVERWLPGLVPNGGQITVRQLLNHTSGLADYAPDEDEAFIRRVLANRRRAWQPRELVAIGTAHPPLFAPGARWSYSNTGYILLGLIVEAAGGNPLGAELQQRIFAPLRLRATSFDTKPRIAGRHAHGYSRGAASTSASSASRGRGPPARSSRPWTISAASTAPCSTAACRAPTSWRKCRRPSPPPARYNATASDSSGPASPAARSGVTAARHSATSRSPTRAQTANAR